MKVRWRWGLFFDHRHLAEMIEKAFCRTRWCRAWWRTRVCTEAKSLGNFVNFSQARWLYSLLLINFVLHIQLIDKVLTFLFDVYCSIILVKQRWLWWKLWTLWQHWWKRETIWWEVQWLRQQMMRVEIELWRVWTRKKCIERRWWC